MIVGRWLPLVVSILVAGLVVVVLDRSAATEEPQTAFADEEQGAHSLLMAARAEDRDVFRLLGGPRSLLTGPAAEGEGYALAVIAPTSPFDTAEVEAVSLFLIRGGHVLVADNFDEANSLTSHLGATFERVRLIESAPQSQNNATISGTRILIQLPNATALRLSPDASSTILAWSSNQSFLDRNGDALIAAGDPLGPFPLMASLEIGARGGKLIVVADPTPFLASGSGNNAQLRQAIVKLLVEPGGVLLIDESRSPTSDPALLALLATHGALTTEPWKSGVIVTCVLLLVVATIVGALQSWRGHVFIPNRFRWRQDLHRPQPRNAATERPTEVRWTRRGIAATMGGAALLVVGAALDNLHAAYTGGILLIVCAAATLTRKPTVTATRKLAVSETHEDTAVDVGLVLETRRRLGFTYEAHDALPSEVQASEGRPWFRARIRGRGRTNAGYQIKPALRGPYGIGPLRARTADLFGFRIWDAYIEPASDLLVHPRKEPLGRIPFKSKNPMTTLGPHLVSRAGDGSEFHSLRDYVTGDSIRSVNWKASARSKSLVVNQRVHESMAIVTLVVDARKVSAAGPARRAPINEACRAALTIASGLLQARDKVRVFAYGERLRELTMPGRPTPAHEISRALADLAAEGNMPLGEAIQPILPTLRPRSPFIFISGLENDDTIAEALALVRQRSAIPVVIALPIITRGEVDGDERAEPGEGQLHEQRQRTIEALQAVGVPFVPATEGMPIATILRLGVV